MRKQMIENAAFEVATQVRAVEDAIDATLAEVAELQSRVMHVNSVAGVGPRPEFTQRSKIFRPPCAAWLKRGAQSSTATANWWWRRARCPGCARSASATRGRAPRPRAHVSTFASSPELKVG